MNKIILKKLSIYSLLTFICSAYTVYLTEVISSDINFFMRTLFVFLTFILGWFVIQIFHIFKFNDYKINVIFEQLTQCIVYGLAFIIHCLLAATCWYVIEYSDINDDTAGISMILGVLVSIFAFASLANAAIHLVKVSEKLIEK